MTGTTSTQPDGDGSRGAASPPAATEFDEVADRLFAAIEAGDVEGVRAVYHPDARIWHNFDQQAQTVEENLATLGWMVRRLVERHYDVTARDQLPDGIVQRHVLRGVTRSGETFALPAAIFVHCRDGRVTAIEEYLDPAGAAALQR